MSEPAMSEPAMIADPGTLKAGLLMESAHAQQKLAEFHIEKLRAHTDDLDGVVRDEIRRTLVDELRALTGECERAAGVLREMTHVAHRRAVAWNLGAVIACTGISGAIVHLTMPSPAAIAALRSERDALARNVAQLEGRGGRMDVRGCGASRRLCVRIERGAPVYGERADYYVVGGY